MLPQVAQCLVSAACLILFIIMADYIPRADAKFNDWQSENLTMLDGKSEPWHIPQEAIDQLKTTQAGWEKIYAVTRNTATRSKADVEEKNNVRRVYEKQWRQFITAWISNNPLVAPDDRVRMGLSSKDNTRTRSSVPATAPIGKIDFSVRFQHKISFADETTPTLRSKPAGVHGCQIWMKLDGAAPTSADELRYLATDTATPYLIEFDGSDGGKTAYYWLRWVNTKGQPGPWSAPISAIVGK